MFARYLMTIVPPNRWVPLPLPAADCARYRVGDLEIAIETADGLPAAALHIDESELPRRLTITEGTIIPTGDDDLLQSGTYNRFIIEADEVRLHNDTFGMLSCFYSLADGVVRLSNSIRLLRRSGALAEDPLGVIENFLFGGWTPNDRTIVQGVRRIRPGTLYQFDLAQGRSPKETRLTDTWTHISDDSPGAAAEQACALWEASLARHIDPIATPIGLMLSGGLDSRLVAAGIASRGKQLVGLTFGDLKSDEVRIAGEVARATAATWVTSGLDADFQFERFAFERVNRTFETMYNLMWDANAPLLLAEGVTHFSTGVLGETIIGGQRDVRQRNRFMKNIRRSVIGPWETRPATADDRAWAFRRLIMVPNKRARNYGYLLAEPYRSLLTELMPAIREELQAQIDAIAAAGAISAGQIIERFESEQYQAQHSRDQERQMLAHGSLVLPTIDRDWASYLTNVSESVKYDHALYYRVIRMLYPAAAAIQVPNLGTHVNKPQLLIELERAWRIYRRSRLTSWVSFSEWMNTGDNLSKYQAMFLAQPSFFDADSVRRYFDDIRAGRQTLYDGGETTSFLNLAWLLDEERLMV